MTEVLCILIYGYLIVLIVHVVFSWVPRPPEPIQPLVNGARALVEPVAGPLRRLIPPVQLGAAALDVSILILFFGISILRAAVCGG